MTDTQSTRGFLSTFFISLFTNGVGGLFLIGRPAFAISLMAGILFIGYSFLAGWFSIPTQLSPQMFALLLSLAAISIPLLLRRNSVPKGRTSKWYTALVVSWILAFLGGYSIRSLAYQPFEIPGGSMAPTLLPGDYLTVDKSAYGYSRFSFPFGLFNFSGRTVGQTPSRGDVVLFDVDGIVYVDRIIGLPGETIQMVDGVPVIDGIALKQEIVGLYQMDDESMETTKVRETLPDGRSYIVLDINPDAIADNTAQFLVPEGSYFMLGDHREDSNDSRFGLGFVPIENILGPADKILANGSGYLFRERRDVNARE